MPGTDATISLTLLAKDLASKEIGTVSGKLDGLSKGGISAGAALKVAGGVMAGGFALATKGALEAEAAQGKFMAATGATREEAKDFVSEMNGLAGSAGAVGMSFEDIAAVGTTVSQQFKVTGEEAQALTEDVLEFAKVTGQDAVGAASQLEDTLSAFGLEASDAAGLMDKLVLSNQKFGTDAGPATLSVLQSMAPALQAMGEDLDYGVGVLNLFETAGLDAAGAQKLLNETLAKLPPGSNFDDVIAKLGAIEDPALRAQAAVDLFGKKAGPGIANAIKPGMRSLDEFQVSMGDAAGATDKAADAMLTLPDKIRGVADKFLAGAREIGQEFGPAITGLASVGSLATPFLSKFPWEKISGPLLDKAKDLGAQILPSLFGVGTKVVGEQVAEQLGEIGSGLGAELGGAVTESAGEAIAEGATGTIVGNLSADAIKKGAARAGGDIGLAASEGIVGSFRSLAAGGSGFLKEMGVSGGVAGRVFGLGFAAAAVFAVPLLAKELGDKSYEVITDILGTPDFNTLVTARMPEAGAAAGTVLGTVTAETANSVMAEKLGPPAPRAIYGPWLPAFHEAGERLGEDIGLAQMAAHAESLKAHTGLITHSFGQVVSFAEQQMKSDAGNAAYRLGKAFDGDLAGGLRDGKDFVSNAMDQVTWAIKHPMELMKQIAEVEGALASKKLASALASNNPQIRTVAEQQKAALIGQWEQLSGKAYTEGVSAANALERGLRTFTPQQVTAFSHIRIPDIFSGRGRQFGGPVNKGEPYIVGEKRPELFVPNQSGRIMPHVPRMGSGGGVNLTVNFHSLAPPTPSEGQKLAQMLLPELTREMRRQRLLPAMR